jgi:NhaP-type Na+/H+ or K+/H+ antiporter
MLRVLKRLGILLAIGGVLGDVVTMLLAPRVLTWFQTPGTGAALCNCADVARQAAHGVIRSQLIGTLIGAVVVAVLGEIVHHARARRRAASSPASGGPSPPTAPQLPPPATPPT